VKSNDKGRNGRKNYKKNKNKINGNQENDDQLG